MIVIAFSWIGLAALGHWVSNALRKDDPINGIAFRCVQAYAKFVHHLHVKGEENIPVYRCDQDQCEPIMVVCNHTAGVDPALVQAACPFEIRWMMAQDMMIPRYAFLWDWLHIIGVDRTAKRDMTAVREAIRHLTSGAVVGVFPEGGIERPARHLRQFMAGVGLIIAKSNAQVLPVFIDGTPITEKAWDSLHISSQSRLTFGPLMRFDGAKQRPDAIARELQAWFERVSGWPVLGPIVIG